MKIIKVMRAALNMSVGLLLLLSTACERKTKAPLALSINDAGEDFVLKAFLDDGNHLEGFPVEMADGKGFSGMVEIKSPEGSKLAEGTVSNGFLRGAFVTWHKNGRINSFEYYINGELSGAGIHWNTNGEIARMTSYVGGSKQGLEIYWDRNSLPQKQILWNSGRPIQVQLFTNGVRSVSFTGEAARDYLLKVRP